MNEPRAESYRRIVRLAELAISIEKAEVLLRDGWTIIRLTTDGDFFECESLWMVDTPEPVPDLLVAKFGEVLLIPSGGYMIDATLDFSRSMNLFGFKNVHDVPHLHFGMD